MFYNIIKLSIMYENFESLCCTEHSPCNSPLLSSFPPGALGTWTPLGRPVPSAPVTSPDLGISLGHSTHNEETEIAQKFNQWELCIQKDQTLMKD